MIFFVAFLLAMLVGSMLSNYFLFKQGKLYYLQLNALRLDPIGLAYFQETHKGNPEIPLAVFYGDSRAANWLPPEMNQFEFTNRGIGSQTTEQVIERFDEHILPLEPDIVIIQVGINDLKTIPLFPDEKDVIVANCKDNIEEIVTRSTEMGATVILATIFPVGKPPLERRLFWSGEVTEAIEEVNGFIRSMAGKHVIVMDTYAILVAENGMINSEYSQDMLHLSDEGYQRLNVDLERLLNDLQKSGGL